jgi:SAM-dependent methyltransferase
MTGVALSFLQPRCWNERFAAQHALHPTVGIRRIFIARVCRACVPSLVPFRRRVSFTVGPPIVAGDVMRVEVWQGAADTPLCEEKGMAHSDALPEDYLRLLQSLEPSYLQSDDTLRQSGFGGGLARWREEREPILDAIDSDGDLLDVGCANGFLLECLVQWGQERGLALTPHGVDLGPRLVELARKRLPSYAANFHVGNAWNWEPPQRFAYVYALYDSVPPNYLTEYVQRLLARCVVRGGRLIMGAYGSRSRHQQPFDIASFLRANGFTVAGTSEGGNPTIARFAWIQK